MLDLDLFRLRVFATVVDERGYSAAARKMHVAQSTVSRHVAELERTCRAQLVTYDGHAVQLTAAGRLVYQTATGMIGDADRLTRVLGDLRAGRTGRVRLGVSMALDRDDFVRDVIAPFVRDNPGIMLSLHFGQSRVQAEAVLAHGLDLAYVMRTDLPDGAHFEPLRRLVFAFLVAETHPLAKRSDVTIDDVRAAGVITSPLRSPDSLVNRLMLRRHGVGDADVCAEVGSQHARMVLAASGVGVLATFVPESGGDQPGLVPLAVGERSPVEMGLVVPPDSVVTADTVVLAAWLRAHRR